MISHKDPFYLTVKSTGELILSMNLRKSSSSVFHWIYTRMVYVVSSLRVYSSLISEKEKMGMQGLTFLSICFIFSSKSTTTGIASFSGSGYYRYRCIFVSPYWITSIARGVFVQSNSSDRVRLNCTC